MGSQPSGRLSVRLSSTKCDGSMWCCVSSMLCCVTSCCAAGPTIPWRPGRADKTAGEHCPPDGRLPDASLGAGHVRDVFGRMGFDDR